MQLPVLITTIMNKKSFRVSQFESRVHNVLHDFILNDPEDMALILDEKIVFDRYRNGPASTMIDMAIEFILFYEFVKIREEGGEKIFYITPIGRRLVTQEFSQLSEKFDSLVKKMALKIDSDVIPRWKQCTDCKNFTNMCDEGACRSCELVPSNFEKGDKC